MAVDLDSPLGFDISCVDDVDPSLELVSGNLCVAHAVLRRISTPRRGLFYAPSYGADVRGRINREFSEKQIARLVEQEGLRDERVRDLRTTVTFVSTPQAADEQEDTARIELLLTTAEGPFRLTGTLGAEGITAETIEQERS
jgi:hypothetical protein